MIIPFKERDELADKTEVLLRNYGISIKAGSPLERAFLEIRYDLEQHLNPSLTGASEDFRRSIRETCGATTFCHRLLRADERGLLAPEMIGHLKLLGDALPSQAVPYAECKPLEPLQKQSSNKVFELIVALAAAEVGSDVELERLSAAKSRNPDVLATIDGILWGFPCKVIASEQSRTLLARILEGLKQLEASPAERGCVVVNLRNLFPHDLLNPDMGVGKGGEKRFRAYDDYGVDRIVRNWLNEFGTKFRKDNRTETVEELFKYPRFGNGFVGYVETAAIANFEKGVMLSALIYCEYFPFGAVQHYGPSEVIAIINALVGPNSKRMPDMRPSPFGIIRVESRM